VELEEFGGRIMNTQKKVPASSRRLKQEVFTHCSFTDTSKEKKADPSLESASSGTYIDIDIH